MKTGVISVWAEVTYSTVHPSVVHDGQSNKGHHSNAHQQVTDGQVHNQHRRHRAESLGCSHKSNDEDVTYAEMHNNDTEVRLPLLHVEPSKGSNLNKQTHPNMLVLNCCTVKQWVQKCL